MTRKWCSSCLESATAMYVVLSMMFVFMMFRILKCLIRWPVKKPGVNMPMTCYLRISAASVKGILYIFIVSGVVVISRFMML